MNLLNHFRARKGGMVKRMFLIGLFVSVLLVISRDIVWLYANFESEMGTTMAEVAISYQIVLLLGLLVAGVGLGHLVNKLIREKRSIFRSPGKGGITEKIMNVWGYELGDTQKPGDEWNGLVEPEVSDETSSSLEEITTPRRGRKPTFTVDRWVPIAQKWENRDPIRDAFTIGELISEHLGTNEDGSPVISEQTYYSVWKDRALKEIQRIERRKKQVISKSQQVITD